MRIRLLTELCQIISQTEVCHKNTIGNALFIANNHKFNCNIILVIKDIHCTINGNCLLNFAKLLHKFFVAT